MRTLEKWYELAQQRAHRATTLKILMCFAVVMSDPGATLVS